MGRQKIISCSSRIESPEHSAIEIFYQNEAISNIELKITDGATRFFKSWLPGKLAEEVPFLVPRICGLCSAAHSICAAMAIEDAYGIEPPESSNLFRTLIMNAETVRSHLIHVGLLELPDILGVVQGDFESPSIQGTSHPVLRDFVKNCAGILQMSQRISQVIAGGAMPVTNQVGGCFPVNIDSHKLGEIGGLFDKMRIQVRALTESLVNEISLKHEPSPLFQLPTNWGYLAQVPSKKNVLVRNNLSCLNADLRTFGIEDLKWFKVNQSKAITVAVRKKETPPVEGGDSRFLSEFPVEGITKIFQETDRHLDLVKDQPFLTGPYARFLLTGESNYRYERVRDILGMIPASWKQNALFFAILRLLECLEICHTATATINGGIDLRPEQKQIPRKPKQRQGWAAIEAPRGTLVHNYSVSPRGYITGVKIFVPTDINLAAINTFLRVVVERLATSEWVKNPRKLLAILNVALRTFDPCISCLAQ